MWSADGKLLVTLGGHTRGVTSAVFSPDGDRIRTASQDYTARLWGADGQLLATLEGHTLPVSSAVFSPDGRRIVTASSDGTARLWSADGKPFARLLGHAARVSSAVFSRDGRRILTASNDNTARLWEIFPTTQLFIDNVKVVVPRCLTPEERQRLHLPIEQPTWCNTLEKWPYNAVSGNSAK